MKLNRVTIENLAAESAAFGADADALDRLCSLIAPFLVDLGTSMILPEQISRSFSDNFDLVVPFEVSSVCLGRLAKRGLILQERVGDAVVYAPKPTNSEKRTQLFGHDQVEEIIADVRAFLSAKPLLPVLDEDEILELLGERLFRLDTFHFGEGSEAPKADWRSGAISEYVLSRREPDGTLPPLLAALAELSLVKSIVTNLSVQRGNIEKSNLVAILDTPIAMALLGASGKEAKESALATFTAAERIGVRRAIFAASIEEMKRVIFSVLELLPPQRTGPAAGALRRNEITEVQLRDIERFPEKYLKQAGIQILPDRLTLFPDSHHFFSDEHLKEFSGFTTRWNDRREAQDHDAELLTLAVRKRRGQSDANVLFCPNVIVTNNWAFAREAKRFCNERFLISESKAPPVLHVNNFSAAIWLAAGFQSNRLIPQKYLLATCERLIAGSGSLLVRAREMFRKLNDLPEQEIELLLRDRDCVLEVFSQTAGDPALLTESNSFALIQAVKDRIVLAELEKHRAELAEREQKHAEELAALQESNALSAKENLQEIMKINDKFERFRDETRAQIEAREYRISALQSEYLERERLRRIAFSRRIRSFQRRHEKRLSKGQAALGYLFPLFAGILTTKTATLFAGVVVSIIIAVVYTLALLKLAPVHGIWLSFRFRYMRRAFLRDFSRAEQAEWDLVLMDDGTVTTKDAKLRELLVDE